VLKNKNIVFKFFCAVRKETLLLLRDRAGIAILFLMPMFLVILMSLLQELGWNTFVKEPKVNVVFVDNDRDTLGIKIRDGLIKSNYFTIIDTLDGRPVTQGMASEAVKKGDYLIAIVIPKGVTKSIRTNVRIMVAKTLAGFGLFNPGMIRDIPFTGVDTVTLFFDPTIRSSFKNSIVSSIKEYNYKIETEMVFRTFNQEIARQFPAFKPPPINYKEAVEFREVFPTYKPKESTPNTVQHNVPAWTIFAMFFIVIPLTSSMIKEREEGSLVRLLSMPVTYMNLLLAKSTVYLIVCLIQCTLMILAGIYVLPLFHVPTLVIGGQLIPLIVISIATALAALGYGIMVGTLTTTQQQAAGFGSVSIIILAAMGGIWVPIYLMPEVMRHVATFSPFNWAITGFYSIFLRGGSFVNILPESFKLIAFFLGTVLITFVYRKYKSPIKR
jgi:ABC-2 type transport system permease protein